MSTLKAHNIEPATGTDVALGAAGDSITVSGDSLKMNTLKDSGGNTLFTSDGAGTVSSVNSGVKGAGPFLLQTNTISSAVSASTFTTNINSTYDHYMFVFVNCQPATDNVDFGFQASINGGSSYGVAKTTTSFYALHNEANSQAAINYSATHDYPGNPNTEKQWLAFGVGNTGDESCSGIIHIFAPASTTYMKHFYIRSNSYGASPESVDFYAAGYMNTTSAINAFRFAMFSGNINYGIIKLYGIT